MPGPEKRVRAFLSSVSRIGFVHEVRPLCPDKMQALLEQHWTPLGLGLTESATAPEVVARLVRITSGKLRLLTRLLTRIKRDLSVNDAPSVSLEIVKAARDSLVIGQA